jgi:ubiquinone/menaquinone biosynthesis C-methylase UbiE
VEEMMADHVCPVWVGYLLASPFRKLSQNPQRILGPYVEKGMTVLDVGCAMGFFSLPMAELVGPDGKVICVDLQEKMIRSLEKRARRSGLGDRIETHVCRKDSLGLDQLREEVDFALLVAVVHEVPDPAKLFSEIQRMLKPGGKALVVEPKGRVSAKDLETTVSMAVQSGFEAVQRPEIRRSRAAVLSKE